MGSTTATIFIGQGHQNHGGIVPTHFILFTENDRPALILRDIEGKGECRVIIPTTENTIDDIYLMIAMYILNEVKPTHQIHNRKGTSIYDIMDADERLLLYDKSLLAFKNTRIKVVFNILHGSHLLNQLEHIKKYPIDFEVSLPAWKQENNSWPGNKQKIGM